MYSLWFPSSLLLSDGEGLQLQIVESADDVGSHFFRSAFRHAIKERQKRHSAFSFPKTLTRVGTIAPISALKKRFSTKDFDRPHKRTQVCLFVRGEKTS